MSYFSVDNMEVLPNGQPSFNRTKGLIDAVSNNPDCQLLEILFSTKDGQVEKEALIVEVACDGFPPGNRLGIQYPERFALVVDKNDRELVDVLALRTDFPALPHMNSTPLGNPLSLCLYFGPKATVLRTWTPQKFLRQLQWWLTSTANENLHAADQPVEQLFFMTPYELILPWNFDEISNDPGMAYQVSRVVERSGGRLSLVLDALPKDGQQLGMDISIITVDTLPVVHGAVERLPSNLGELADQMASKGIDVLLPLRQSLLENITANGLASKGLTLRVILLLRTPIVRAAGNLQERIEHKAFFFHADRREIGRAIGAYLFSENKFYADVFGHVDEGQNAEWRAKVVSAIEVLSFNSKSRLRIQSGVSSEGPKGVLVGVGSLGSAMLNIWTRCGWGEWSVIDNDHIKPHNLVRHTAFGVQVGELKVKVVSQLCEATTHGASVVTPINADATSLTQEVVAALQKAQLVVDASASLDFPRAISKVDQVGRHISVFITPDGNAAVMLAEDSERLIRLLSLEAQYYRAVINSGWGMNHLNGHLGTYWSGASCRDISMALPYSRVLVHAACLAEQVQQVADLKGSLIRVWQRNPQTGAVELYSVETQANRYIEHGDRKSVV